MTTAKRQMLFFLTVKLNFQYFVFVICDPVLRDYSEEFVFLVLKISDHLLSELLTVKTL